MKKNIYIYLLYVVYTVTLTIFATVFKCVYRQRYTLTNYVLFNGKCNDVYDIGEKQLKGSKEGLALCNVNSKHPTNSLYKNLYK